jgi:hypothetical protein
MSTPVSSNAKTLDKAVVSNLKECPNYLVMKSNQTPPKDRSISNFEGWGYYEVSAWNQLRVVSAPGGNPAFRKIRRNTVFKVASDMNLRATAPSAPGELSKIPVRLRLRAGECLTAVGDARTEDEITTTKAESGGWLRLNRAPCPTRT